MTTVRPRRNAELSVATAAIVALLLSLASTNAPAAPASAQAGSARPAADEAEIDAFRGDLDKGRGNPPVATTAIRETSLAAAPAVSEHAPSPLQDERSPFGTLLLMMGGIALCALATIGLTLVIVAWRREVQRSKRGRRRRFRPDSPDRAVQPVHR
jgi:Spy/CpxP family protein refolding chaperone